MPASGGWPGVWLLLSNYRAPSARSALGAQPDELDVVIPDEKPVLAGQQRFDPPHEIELFLLEVAIVQDLTAP